MSSASAVPLSAPLVPAGSAALGYSEKSTLATLWDEFAYSNDLGRDAFNRRVALLGDAFQREGLRIARVAYEHWLFGESKTKPAKSGEGGYESFDYVLLPFETFSNTVTVRRMVLQALLVVRDALAELRRPDGGGRAEIVKAGNEMARQLRPGDHAVLWKWDEEAQGNPPLLIRPVITSPPVYVTILLEGGQEVAPDESRDEAAALAEVVPQFRIRIPEVAATLGRFPLRVYLNAEIQIAGDGTATAVVNRFGIRIWDQYDFEGNQPLGWWYPEFGHVLPPLVAVGDILTNAHFSAFAEKCKGAFNEFLRLRHPGARSLQCKSYKLISEMVTTPLQQDERVTIAL